MQYVLHNAFCLIGIFGSLFLTFGVTFFFFFQKRVTRAFMKSDSEWKKNPENKTKKESDYYDEHPKLGDAVIKAFILWIFVVRVRVLIRDIERLQKKISMTTKDIYCDEREIEVKIAEFRSRIGYPKEKKKVPMPA